MTVSAEDVKEDVTAVADAIRMKTAVVILNWNTEGFLKRFLPGLVDSVSKVEGAEVIVADNSSTDGSRQLLKTVFPEVRTLLLDSNLGFTGGYDEAFRKIHEDYHPEYFLLINSDIEVSDGWLQPLVDWMDNHPECGACGPKLHSWYERDRFEYAGAAGGYLDRFGYPFCRGRIMKRLEEDRGQYDSPENVFWVTGACLLVRSSVFSQLNGLDSRFFAHMEEIDLCWRMQLKGWKVTVVPESVVWHVGGGTLPSHSPFKLFLNYRNNLLMLQNNMAMTMALRAYKEGMGIGEAAAYGARKGSNIVRFRKMLDRLSAAVYLISFRKDDFDAVIKAHKEFEELKSENDVRELASYLEEYADKASVEGMYGRWIVSASLFKGKKIFRSIRKKDFYKI
ncbi:MAG: glycosyltransferase family 2 protein [Bacteroidales bacterium]|nr:glycosyltransferase family 2 protein [Bacteroidales bacterium]